MRILIACEESQTVCRAFRKLGHEAYSCDIMECSGGHPEWHIHGDVLPLLRQKWDMIIAFPPCTYLSSSGMHWTTRGLRDPQLTEDALVFVRAIMDADSLRIAVENPIGCISSRIRKPDQIIQPWMFGDDASKRTCLWLKGLSHLQPTNPIPPRGWQNIKFAYECDVCVDCGDAWCNDCGDHYADCSCIGPTQDDVIYKQICQIEFATLLDPAPKMRWGNQTDSGQNKLPPSKDRAKIRSKTYQGIAEAMANQWSGRELAQMDSVERETVQQELF